MKYIYALFEVEDDFDLDNHCANLLEMKNIIKGTRLYKGKEIACGAKVNELPTDAIKNVDEWIKEQIAKEEHKNVQSVNPKKYSNFKELYDSYMYREINKYEFAGHLGVSVETLDELISKFTKQHDIKHKKK